MIPDWVKELPFPVTLCDREGIIVHMNDASKKAYAKNGGGDLIGKNLLDCHPGASKVSLQQMLEKAATNTYTIEKNGVKKLIHQSPWFENGVYAGLVEISLPLPNEMPHFVRG